MLPRVAKGMTLQWLHSPYPTGDGSDAVLRSMLPNSRRVRLAVDLRAAI